MKRHKHHQSRRSAVNCYNSERSISSFLSKLTTHAGIATVGNLMTGTACLGGASTTTHGLGVVYLYSGVV